MQPGRALVRVDSQKSRQGLLKHQLRLKRKDSAPGEEPRYEIEPIVEKLSFEKGFFLFIRAVQLLTEKNKGVIVVGLAGPSGAGKTVFTDKVSTFMPGIATISMDNYNDASRLVDGNFDDPRLTDYDLLLKNLHDLREGRAVDVPVYDFKQSKRVGYRRVEVPASRAIIVEGIYALSEKVRPLLDLRVSVTGGVHFDLVKRVLRDINRSGQEPEDIIHQISETVFPMYKAFIEPDLKEAHIKIVNKFNPFTGFQSAMYILKSWKPVPEEKIRSVMGPEHKESNEETYDIYLLPPGEDPETCQSYLRMRNRDGRYSLMFEEWVTDGPFIISPRITFEVSVRLLGGLMALGYTMSSILKRVSHVFIDDKVIVKVDKLEQLHRSYVQVQGKDRAQVQEIANKLGLEGTFIPRSYIEQIQLEQLIVEVQNMPEELKTRLSFTDGANTKWLENNRQPPRLIKGPTRALAEQTSVCASAPQAHRPEVHGSDSDGLAVGTRWADNDNEREQPGQDSPFPFAEAQQKLLELHSVLTEKLDELLGKASVIEARMGEMERRLATMATNPAPAPLPLLHRGSSGGYPPASAGVHPPPSNGGPVTCNGPQLQVGSYGRSVDGGNGGSGGGAANGGASVPWSLTNGITGVGRQSYTDLAGYANGHGHRDTSLADSDTGTSHELKALVRGQRVLLTQLEVLNNRVNEIAGTQHAKRLQRRGFWEDLVGHMRTSHSGLVSGVAVAIATSAVVVALVAVRMRQRE